jgi:hypothetical protein
LVQVIDEFEHGVEVGRDLPQLQGSGEVTAVERVDQARSLVGECGELGCALGGQENGELLKDGLQRRGPRICECLVEALKDAGGGVGPGGGQQRAQSVDVVVGEQCVESVGRTPRCWSARCRRLPMTPSGWLTPTP